MTLDQLADRIQIVDDTLRQQTAHAVNCMLTARNWLIGCYIVEYEQKGADRAQYGEQLLKTLAHRINRKGMNWRRLYEFRGFYTSYPQLYMEILNYLQSQSSQTVTGQANILRSLPAIFQDAECQSDAIRHLHAFSAMKSCNRATTLLSVSCYALTIAILLFSIPQKVSVISMSENTCFICPLLKPSGNI